MDRTRQTILIIDDTPINIRMLSELLIDDYEVLFATSGADGLQRALQDFDKNPNAAALARSNIAASAKAAAAAAKAETAAKPPSAPLVTPAPVAPAAPSATAAPPAAGRSFAEMEQMYLDGKISAKAFQLYLRGQKLRPTGVAATPPPATNVAVTVTDTNVPALPRSPDLSPMNDVERRLDELIRAQEAREKAATNQVSAPTGPKTKRQKLDELLKQLLDGKVSEEDYKTRREKILAEPD